MVRRLFRSLLAAGLLLVLTACVHSPVAGLLVTKGAKEKEIAALRVDYEARITTARQEVSVQKDRVIADKDGQMVKAAGSFVAQGLVFDAIAQPTRTDLLFRNYAVEGHAALGNVQPSAASLREIAERVARERDEARTSLAQLQAAHERVVTENTALAEATRLHEAELAALEAKLTAVERERDAKIAAKQAELIEVQGKLIAAEKARADDRAALQALKTKASTALGIVGLIAVALAIYVPVFRAQCAGFGALCLLGAGAIWLIQPWMVAVTVAGCVLALIAWMAIKHRRKERATDALALSMQDLRDKGGDIAAAAETALADRASRYRRAKDGTLVTERDPAVEREIETTLSEYDALPAKSAT